MNIAVLAFSSLPNDVGGAQIFTHNLVRFLLKRNHSVHFYLPYKYAKGINYYFKHESRRVVVKSIFCYENGFVQYAPFVLDFALFIKQLIYKYDVWQVIGAYPSAYITSLIKYQAPIVLRSYGVDVQKDERLQYGLRLNPLYDKRIKRSVVNMTGLVALTETVKDCYINIGAPNNRIRIIPNAIDYHIFKYDINCEKVRLLYMVPQNDIFILSTGRYHIKKGFEIIPPVAKLLKEYRYKFTWLIIGKNTSKLRNSISKYGVDDCVFSHDGFGVGKSEGGSIDINNVPSRNLVDIYKSADVYVMPSLLETFGMVLVEAMASGLPVVTTDSPGCRDVVKHQYNGLVAKRSDIIGVTNSIIRIISDSTLRKLLIKNGYATACRHDWSNIIVEYEDLYNSVVEN